MTCECLIYEILVIDVTFIVDKYDLKKKKNLKRTIEYIYIYCPYDRGRFPLSPPQQIWNFTIHLHEYTLSLRHRPTFVSNIIYKPPNHAGENFPLSNLVMSSMLSILSNSLSLLCMLVGLRYYRWYQSPTSDGIPARTLISKRSGS